MLYTKHFKLKIEQHEPKKPRENPDARGR